MTALSKIILPFLIGLTACVGPQLAADSEKNDATRVYLQCLRTATERLDDRTSDASSVASGIVATCEPQYRHVMRVYEQGLSAAARTSFDSEVTPAKLPEAIRVVLEVRHERNQMVNNR